MIRRFPLLPIQGYHCDSHFICSLRRPPSLPATRDNVLAELILLPETSLSPLRTPSRLHIAAWPQYLQPSSAIATQAFWSTHPDTIPDLLLARILPTHRRLRIRVLQAGTEGHVTPPPPSSISIPLDAASADVAANWEEEERQPLHITVERHSFDMVQPLLSHGPPVDLFSGLDGPGYREIALDSASACMHASDVRRHPNSSESSTTLRIPRKKGISGNGVNTRQLRVRRYRCTPSWMEPCPRLGRAFWILIALGIRVPTRRNTDTFPSAPFQSTVLRRRRVDALFAITWKGQWRRCEVTGMSCCLLEIAEGRRKQRVQSFRRPRLVVQLCRLSASFPTKEPSGRFSPKKSCGRMTRSPLPHWKLLLFPEGSLSFPNLRSKLSATRMRRGPSHLFQERNDALYQAHDARSASSVVPLVLKPDDHSHNARSQRRRRIASIA
ncbi:hypothetical protein C8F01DRAFT_692850 [Mycena amicta]|nr:hypothetical protein C8F01DRAFT_692850 [Mycena amicta]